jgi:hypothetical protein
MLHGIKKLPTRNFLVTPKSSRIGMGGPLRVMTARQSGAKQSSQIGARLMGHVLSPGDRGEIRWSFDFLRERGVGGRVLNGYIHFLKM